MLLIIELIADGSAATSETSGGGSGGSILLSSQYLTFHGYAHANGGMVRISTGIVIIGRREWRRWRWRWPHYVRFECNISRRRSL